MIDIIETVYRGASKGRGLVVSPKGVWLFALQYFILKTCLQITRLAIGISLLLIVDPGGTGSITRLPAYLPPDPHLICILPNLPCDNESQLYICSDVHLKNSMIFRSLVGQGYLGVVKNRVNWSSDSIACMVRSRLGYNASLRSKC